MPFTEETLEFLVRNKLMDSREWFHEHHGEYERLVVEPLADLVSALTPALAEIDPNIVCVPKVGKSISRIWRDTRRGPGLPIYRDVMWLTFLRAKQQGLPGFWFEFSPRALRWAVPGVEKWLAPRPKIHRSKCIGCGKCAEICPGHTITVENGKAHIVPRACIRCFCCHEMCPAKAIDVKRAGIFNL